MGEAICTVIALLFMFGSFSIFMSIITEKHYERPIKDDVTDFAIANELIDHMGGDEEDFEVDEDLLED